MLEFLQTYGLWLSAGGLFLALAFWLSHRGQTLKRQQVHIQDAADGKNEDGGHNHRGCC